MSRYTAASDTFAPEISSVSSLPVRYFETVHKRTVSLTTVAEEEMTVEAL